ncbi:MAG: NF038129 family PEP-CTERM protein [Alphaproteobacteria bacterium]|nr:NF038129 family PEP-CTERM protein [Alphaproteobacteria bacterium]
MSFKFGFICAAALAFFTTVAEAATYQFNINTSSLAGTSGYLDFQFGNSSFGPFQEVTATISTFQGGGGTLANIDPYTSTDQFGFPDVLGKVFGTLPAAVTLDDNGSVSVTEYFHPFTFGNSISFLLTLGGPAVDAPLCAGFGGCDLHAFGIGILDGGENYLFTTDPNAFLLGGVQVNRNGTLTSYLNPGAASALAITAVPEPVTLTLFSAGLIGVGALRRKKAARA